jgi:hypothetical protein
MDGIRRVAVRILGAPFTRRARRDVGFCVIGALTGGAGFVVVVATLVVALVMCGSLVGAVIGLPLAVAAIGLARLQPAARSARPDSSTVRRPIGAGRGDGCRAGTREDIGFPFMCLEWSG